MSELFAGPLRVTGIKMLLRTGSIRLTFNREYDLGPDDREPRNVSIASDDTDLEHFTLTPAPGSVIFYPPDARVWRYSSMEKGLLRALTSLAEQAAILYAAFDEGRRSITLAVNAPIENTAMHADLIQGLGYVLAHLRGDPTPEAADEPYNTFLRLTKPPPAEEPARPRRGNQPAKMPDEPKHWMNWPHVEPDAHAPSHDERLTWNQASKTVLDQLAIDLRDAFNAALERYGS